MLLTVGQASGGVYALSPFIHVVGILVRHVPFFVLACPQGSSDLIRGKRWQLDKQDGAVSEDSWDDDSDLDGSGESEGEGLVGDDSGRSRRPRKFVGGLQLSDQLRLLSPTSKTQTLEEMSVGATASSAATDDASSLYAKVNKKNKSGENVDQDRPRTGSDPTPTTTCQSVLTSRGSSHSWSSDYGDRELMDSVKEKEKSGHFKASNQPPWIQMVFKMYYFPCAYMHMYMYMYI